MKSQSIVRKLLQQVMGADADEERRKKKRKVLKTRKYPDEDDDDPIDADPMRSSSWRIVPCGSAANFAFLPAVVMTAKRSINSAEFCREEARRSLCDETLIKQLETGISSIEIWQKAVDVLRKRIASGEVSDNMLLRVMVSLSKSSAVLAAAERASPSSTCRSRGQIIDAWIVF
jgi:hypothetical protein